MNFVPLPGPSWLTVALILLVGGAIIVPLGFAFKRTLDRASFWLIPVVLLLSGAITLTVAFASIKIFSSPHFERGKVVAEQIESTYGKEISSGSIVQSLDYPADLPTDDFRVYGKVTEDSESADGFVRSQTYLLWKGGKMVLATSTDGESFSELEPR